MEGQSACDVSVVSLASWTWMDWWSFEVSGTDNLVILVPLFGLNLMVCFFFFEVI